MEPTFTPPCVPALPIAAVEAWPLAVPVEVRSGGARAATQLSCVIVRIETRDGRVGHGFTAITEEEVVAAAIREVAGPAIVGLDALGHEAIWDRLYWLLSPRGQTGYASHAMAAIDVALWDLKGQALGQPVWRLLGAARDRVPVYVTFGFGFLDRDQLAAAAREWVDLGFRRLKMTVGQHALARRDEPRPPADVIAEDLRRVAAVREAVGDEVALYVDANCSLDAVHATRLAAGLEALGVAGFEEPVKDNDCAQLALLRSRTRLPLSAGQNEGLAWRFRDLLVQRAVDVLQPNVVIGGGYTQCAGVVQMAAAFGVPVGNGGAWAPWNMHLHAGLAHGGLVEHHHVATLLVEQLYRDLPRPESGWLALPDRPGLGFAPDPDRLREAAARPTSRGRGKA